MCSATTAAEPLMGSVGNAAGWSAQGSRLKAQCSHKFTRRPATEVPQANPLGLDLDLNLRAEGPIPLDLNLAAFEALYYSSHISIHAKSIEYT